MRKLFASFLLTAVIYTNTDVLSTVKDIPTNGKVEEKAQVKDVTPKTDCERGRVFQVERMRTVRKLLLPMLLLSAPAYASEVTLVKSDNTVIRTVHLYGNSQMEMETEEVAPRQDDTFGFALCVDEAKKLPTRQRRLKAVDDCLRSDNTIAIGGIK
jgi:hypothetical protein